ncbi:MBL fold metallo-hydrolase [Pseudoalteromonas fenneropenaei]|uniref:beta-lactamase n=1 Tax=Pseudoalteromonas fenneropenaei TaxID=1737459 RepID=A0ABV7CPH7_9GAMM
MFSSLTATAVEFKQQKLSEHLTVLYGEGGNIAVHHGQDGLYIVDDQFARLSDEIKKQLQLLHPAQAEFVINTHHHGDHTGGNENFANAGSHVIAQHQVRHRLQDKHGSDSAYLPRLTFSEDLSLHFNQEHAQLRHFAHAHTDGDAVVFFTVANAVHMGDLFFNTGSLPFVDVDSGGSVDGLLQALRQIAAMIDDNTKVIPGHGEVTNRATLLSYIKLIEDARTSLLNSMAQLASEDEVVKADPLAPLGLEYLQWLSKERVTRLFYRSLKQSDKIK